MIVTKIMLHGFRNYESLELSLAPGINIFYGSNAQGKTNLLEAVYFCATGRSHRTSNDKECIKNGQEEAYIRLFYDVKGKKEQIELHLRRNGRKSAAVNGYPIQKINELFGRFHVVVFSPEDLYLVKGMPQKRRKFTDMEISQFDPVYLYDLQQYYKVVRQRNILLKNASSPTEARETLFAWDKQLSHYGVRIMNRRRAFIEELQQYAGEIHHQISGGKEKVEILYESSAPFEEKEFQRELSRGFIRDLKTGTTGMGPQHDDLVFRVNGVDIRVYGSQGQQRTMALSLKLAEMKMMKDHLGDDPVLLLDDVMSELDEQRQKQLAAYIEDRQTIITCTGVEDSIRQLNAEKMFHVEQGTIKEQNTSHE